MPSHSDFNAMSDVPQERVGWFKRTVATLLMVTLQVSAFAQVTGPIIRGSYGQPQTGFAPNGTFIQNGVVVGNPHQQMHDLENSSLWTLGAAALTNTTDPSFVQGTMGQMQGVAAPLAEAGGLSMSRLYINTSPANPYLAAAPFTNPTDQANQANNAQIWSQVAAGTGGFQSAGSTWLAWTNPNSSGAIYNAGLTGFVDKGVVNAAMDPKGGAVAVWLTQGADVTRHLAAVQQQNAQLLGSRIFFNQQTITGVSPTATGFASGYDQMLFEQAIGTPQRGDDSFKLGYVRDDGSAQFFDLSDRHFRDYSLMGGGGSGASFTFSQNDAGMGALLGKDLRKAAEQREKGLNAAAGLDFSYFKDSRALFMQGMDLYRHVGKGDWGLLDGLRSGAIGPGHPDYERARALSEDAFRQAYQYHAEYDTKLKYSKEAAAYQAQHLQLGDVSNADLFGKGLNLFDKKGDPEQERLLGMLQRGELSESDPRYQEIRGLAEARFKVAYQKALEPPKKPNPLKQIVAVVVAAVAVMFAQPYIATWALNVGMAVGATSTFAVNAIGTAISASISSSISTTIATGSISKGLEAGFKAGATGLLTAGLQTVLGGGLPGEVLSRTVAQTAVYGGNFGDALVGNALNAVADTVSKDVAGQIKNADLSPLGKELAHAGLGCAAGAMRAQDASGCGSGAAGAVTGHLVAQWLDPAGGRTLSDSEVDFYSRTSGIAGGVAAALVGSRDNVQGNFGIGQSAGDNSARNNHFSQSPFPNVRLLVSQENARLTAECGSSCTEADYRRIDQQVAKLEAAANLATINQRGGLTTQQAEQFAQLAMELMPGFSNAESLAQLLTGRQTLTGEEANRFWATVGLVPLAGGMLARVGNTASDVAQALRAAERASDPGLINDANRLFRQYANDIETQTGYRLTSEQRTQLANELRTNNHAVTLTPAENQVLRSEFNNARPRLISEWEANTGQKWPQYTQDVLSSSGTVLRRAGDPFDAHHVIPVTNAGPPEWWNITPAKFPEQHAPVHRPNGPLQNLQRNSLNK